MSTKVEPLQTTIATAQAIREENENRYVRLAKEAAAGRRVTPDEIEEASRLGKRPLEGFWWLVEKLKARDVLRQRATTHDALHEEFKSLQVQIEGLHAELEEAAAAHHRKVKPLQQRLEIVKTEMTEVWYIPMQLVQECPSPELRGAMKQLSMRIERLDWKRKAALEELEKWQAYRSGGRKDLEERRAAMILKNDNELNSLIVQIADLNGEMEALQKEMREF